MKKIGIALIGEMYNLSFRSEEKDKLKTFVYHRNWQLSKDNIKNKLIDSFKKDNDVKIYITTYEDVRADEAIEFYSPTKSLLLPPEGSHQRTTYIKGMENLLDQDLDFIIPVRFDLAFDQDVVNFDWNYEKMNFVSKEMMGWDTEKYVTDTFFGFPKKYLESFIKSIRDSHAYWENTRPGDPGKHFMHDIYRHMVAEITEENIHFLVPNKQLATIIPNMYRIVRA
jgi:hypothetical protein